MATDAMENAERWAHELIAAFERDPIPRPHNVVNVTVARWALALRADNERLREDFARFYDAIDKAQRIDNTGGDSAVSVALWSWAERRAAAPEGATE